MGNYEERLGILGIEFFMIDILFGGKSLIFRSRNMYFDVFVFFDIYIRKINIFIGDRIFFLF